MNETELLDIYLILGHKRICVVDLHTSYTKYIKPS